MPTPPTQDDPEDAPSAATVTDTVAETEAAASESASVRQLASGDGIVKASEQETVFETADLAGAAAVAASPRATAAETGGAGTLVDPLFADTDPGRDDGGRETQRDTSPSAPTPRAPRASPAPARATKPTGSPGSGSSGDRDGDKVGGRYELVGVGPDKAPLGQGAFGEVWQAHDDAFDREVALKILKTRMCRPAVLLRFELEKQVIARMEHPNIARVFDGGTFPDGRPYLAMELIRGRTLMDFCNGHRLPVADRLQLFMKICRAVHHAHERFVLHRDLKPSNIMVVEHDGEAVPKVIDFGIAKVLEEGEFSAEAAPTVEGSLKGTPAYMSPEQTRGTEGLTSRSDIYTLGVILYELLTGDTPVSHHRTRELDLVSLIQAIRNEDPLVPSASVTRRETSPSATALDCGTPPERLSRQLSGDLDVIALRALDKEPERRYDSAADFAADIERFLADEPILARPPSPSYRLRKFVRRHKVAVAAGAAVLAALVVTALVSTWSFFSVRTALGRETIARQAAVVSEKVAVEQKEVAEIEREKATASKLVAEQKEKEARVARDAAIVARDEAEGLINFMLFDLREQLEPLGRSRLLASVSEKAEQYFSRQPPSTDNDSLERNRAVMFGNRGRLLLAQGKVVPALAACRQAHAIMEKRLSAGDDPARRFDLATAAHGLGLALRASGEPEAARPHFADAQPFLRTRHAARDAEAGRLLVANLEQLGDLQLRAGQTDAALALFREQESSARALSAAAPEDTRATQYVALACEKVGTALQKLGRHRDAQPKFEEEVRLLRALAGAALDDLALRRTYLVSLEKLGSVLLALQRPEDARQQFQERLREAEVLVRVDPRRVEFRRDLAAAHQQLAHTLLQLGKSSEALTHARTDLELTTALARDFPLDTEIRGDLATSHFQVGAVLLRERGLAPSRLEEARGHLEQAAAILRSLIREGKIDERGRTVLAELEKALADLAKARGSSPRPR